MNRETKVSPYHVVVLDAKTNLLRSNCANAEAITSCPTRPKNR